MCKARQQRWLVNHHKVPVDFLDALFPVFQVASLEALRVGKDAKYCVCRDLLRRHDAHPVPEFVVVIVPHGTQIHQARSFISGNIQVF
eukprot:Skav233026  [mRNA]  locus=scaffold909:564299:569607:- [translate_table: standard]